MKVIDDNFQVCGFCVQAIVNDDYSGLDYYFKTEEAEARMDLIHKGMDQWGPDTQIVLPAEPSEEFAWTPCECCGDTAGGDRTRMQVLKQHPHPYTERDYYK